MENIMKPISYEEFLKKVKMPIKNLHNAFDNYSNGILDVNEIGFNLNECNSYSYNKLNEDKYIKFMKDIFNLNKNKPVIIDFYLKDLDNEGCIKILDNLDYDEKVIFINHLRNLKTNNIYFELDNEKLLNFITKLSTRELHFCTMYFNDFPIVIWGNYNLAFPIFFKNHEHIELYSKIARDNKLFIRDISII